MAKKTKNDNVQYVRKETFWLGTLLALAVGFFGGVMFAVLKSDTAAVPVAGRPQTQAPQAPAASPARPNMIASLEDETVKNPQNTKVWIQLGNEYFDSSQHEKAIWAYRKALELNPNDARALYLGAEALLALGKKERAALWAGRALSIDPEDPYLSYGLACFNSRLGEKAKALEYFEMALDAGFAHREWIENDSDLDPIRKHPRFRKLVSRLQG